MTEIPLRTRRFEETSLALEDDCVYMFASTGEDRTQIGSRFPHSLQLIVDNRYCATFRYEGKSTQINLRDSVEFDNLFCPFASRPVYIDLTGMSHSVWAPLVRSGMKTVKHLRAVYVEPRGYRRNPTAGGPSEMFDLSETTEGPAALPGFSRLASSDEGTFAFVPLLGFEGARVLHFTETIELGQAHVFPIAPTPGFRLEYPSHTIASNRQFIESTKSWANLKYVAADDPFDLLRKLREISRETADEMLRVALVGTKPHALGAVLFSALNPDKIELLYDFPVARTDRTVGIGSVLVYDLEGFVSEYNGT